MFLLRVAQRYAFFVLDGVYFICLFGWLVGFVVVVVVVCLFVCLFVCFVVVVLLLFCCCCFVVVVLLLLFCCCCRCCCCCCFRGEIIFFRALAELSVCLHKARKIIILGAAASNKWCVTFTGFFLFVF